MLYEQFFHWLFSKRNRRKHCKHNWVDTGCSYSSWRDMWSETGFRHLWKCTKCGAKEKRTPKSPPSFIWV